MTKLGDIGSPGPVDRDISGTDKLTGTHRGPFEIVTLMAGKTPSYPVLWAHDAGSGRESQIDVAPDADGWVRAEMAERALEVWATATRLHINRDFRLNSQALAACVTAEECIGGRAWPGERAVQLHRHRMARPAEQVGVCCRADGVAPRPAPGRVASARLRRDCQHATLHGRH